ncbi:9291_t:CDS:2, partial [Racocetra fulgida]
MGSNCRFLHFSQDKAEINPNDEHHLDLLEVVEKKDNHYSLYIITQNAEFDLTKLRFEKGFRINEDGSVTKAHHQAFKINLRVCECKHEATIECNRSLIFDVKLSAAYLDWVSASIGLSHENSDNKLEQHMKYTKHSYERVIRGVINLPMLENVTAEEIFIKDVKNVVNDTIHDNEKKGKLREIWGKYGHFYARRLTLGGAIIRNEKYTKNSAENSEAKITKAQVGVGVANVFDPNANVVHDNRDMYNNYNINTNNAETIIGGTDYSQNDKNFWIQSLNSATEWKIIGYEEVYSLFELLDKELKEKVLNVMGHQILE